MKDKWIQFLKDNQCFESFMRNAETSCTFTGWDTADEWIDYTLGVSPDG